MPVGIGYDIHRLVEGRKLMLGGVHVPYERGCLGHSDADPLLHAITDALLGAASGELPVEAVRQMKQLDSFIKEVGRLYSPVINVPRGVVSDFEFGGYRIPAGTPVRLGLAAAPMDEEDVFLYHKTSQRAVYEQARASRPDCDEVLLWNRRGELTETTIANLALALDGRLVTPPVASGLLAGVLRAELLETGQLHEQTLRLDDLARCQGITLISALRGRREAVWCGCVE